MKILFVASCNDKNSGAFLSLTKLASLLKDKFGHDVCVVLPRNGDGEELLDDNGIKHVFIRSYDWTMPIGKKMTWKFFLRCCYQRLMNHIASFRLAFVIRKDNIDIVHNNTSRTYAGALAAKLTRTPYIWHIREFLEEDQEIEFVDKKYAYHLLQDAKYVIAISNSIYDKYAKVLNDNLVMIYNGIDPKKFMFPNKEILRSKTCNILIVGRISEKKDKMKHLMLVKSCWKMAALILSFESLV